MAHRGVSLPLAQLSPQLGTSLLARECPGGPQDTAADGEITASLYSGWGGVLRVSPAWKGEDGNRKFLPLSFLICFITTAGGEESPLLQHGYRHGTHTRNGN